MNLILAAKFFVFRWLFMPLKTMSINGVGWSAFLCASHKRQLIAREKLLEP